ncbi:hypothetical protein TIFTF001_007021 [Ficus carica]|uniref:Uncharacterized protein n=1 Tax=Ficus carica TaxID=3494 RepID=A0AA87ZSD3_FICCA|nr:hypothetical protein TIFTF001_007021 [Ficus carica]
MSRQLHICFFPLMAQGHMIPIINMAQLFASRGLKTTIITTPFNAELHSDTINDSQNIGLDITILVIKFPCADTGMPQGRESPDVAAKLDIPRIVFHGTGFFSLCASLSVLEYEPHEKVESDSEPFVFPNLPDEVILIRKQLPPFYELEPDYADHYSMVLGRKAWHIGPILLLMDKIGGKGKWGRSRGFGDEHEFLKWLDLKEANSVVYICFGSMSSFSDAQLMEIAMGLEASGKQFIWVVKKERKEGVRGE